MVYLLSISMLHITTNLASYYNTFIISTFLWFRSPSWCRWFSVQHFTRLKTRHWPGLQSHLRFRVLFQAYWLLAEFSSLASVELKFCFLAGCHVESVSVPRGIPQLPNICCSLQHGSVLLQVQKENLSTSFKSSPD